MFTNVESLLFSAPLLLSLLGNSYGAAIDISPRSPLPNLVLEARACSDYETVSHSFQPDDIVISRAKTRELQNQLNTITTAAEICAIIFGITIGEGALPCAIFAAETNFFANKAGECAGKNQCLEMKWKVIPECVGGSGSHCC